MPVARIPFYRESRLGTHPAIGDVLPGAEPIASWRCSVALRETIRRQSHRCGGWSELLAAARGSGGGAASPSTPDRRRAWSNSDWVDTKEELRVDLVRRIGSSGAGACGKFSCRLRTRTGNHIVHISAVGATAIVLV